MSEPKQAAQLARLKLSVEILSWLLETPFDEIGDNVPDAINLICMKVVELSAREA